MKQLGALLAPLVVLGVASCSGSAGSTPAPGPSGPPPTNGIQHIVVMMQENRSFDNVFAGYPRADTTLVGGCTPNRWCKGSQMVHLH
ncbi:MAG: alkaline phosphatase family protein, partial [Candidatus Cybelea sp.]